MLGLIGVIGSELAGALTLLPMPMPMEPILAPFPFANVGDGTGLSVFRKVGVLVGRVVFTGINVDVGAFGKAGALVLG